MTATTAHTPTSTRVGVLLLTKFVRSRLLRRFFKRSSSVNFISSRLCLKAMPWTTLAEAHAMIFIRENTNVPVPKVYAAFEHKGQVYILMERIRGHGIYRGWFDRSEESRRELLLSLKNMILQWRSLRPPDSHSISNVDGGPIFDPRIPPYTMGPFDTTQAFHLALRNGITTAEHREKWEKDYPDICKLEKFHEQPWSDPVFTHGDLSSLNILCKDNKIVGIVDWETAGWLPPYWEYVTAWNVNPRNEFWRHEVDKFLEPWPHASDMEEVRCRYFGDF